MFALKYFQNNNENSTENNNPVRGTRASTYLFAMFEKTSNIVPRTRASTQIIRNLRKHSASLHHTESGAAVSTFHITGLIGLSPGQLEGAKQANWLSGCIDKIRSAKRSLCFYFLAANATSTPPRWLVHLQDEPKNILLMSAIRSVWK